MGIWTTIAEVTNSPHMMCERWYADMDGRKVNVKEAEGTAKYGSWSMTVEAGTLGFTK